MFGGGSEQLVTSTLVRSYEIIQEIYDDILTPAVLHQTDNPHDLHKLQKITTTIAKDRALEEIKYPL